MKAMGLFHPTLFIPSWRSYDSGYSGNWERPGFTRIILAAPGEYAWGAAGTYSCERTLEAAKMEADVVLLLEGHTLQEPCFGEEEE